ncbi:PREDICTED: exostosin-like 2 [Amphimedon queenslandica]|uniref:Glycosyl transferase 64 domain-containing protein n=1 Tax=Amphimedon queenslandica TaxID=400682 RepID=A0A1X7UGQ9_AMPQE|nr:PREDICTED: exostosin-like 2 [Amphimedon queenslandica]|eukprot:XP_011405216.2 PREDICTED: exostosin-like 2 [Amphimedon queenslandica]
MQMDKKTLSIALLSLTCLFLICLQGWTVNTQQKVVYYPSTHNFICAQHSPQQQRADLSQQKTPKDAEKNSELPEKQPSSPTTTIPTTTTPLTVTTNSRRSSGLSTPSLPAVSPKEIDMKYYWRIFRQTVSDLHQEQFTILIMTYKRTAILQRTIPHYCSAGPSLHKVLIVWNDVMTPIPESLTKIPCGQTKLEFITSKENKLTNRFVPYKEIETECVAIIDDDRKVLIPDLLFGFETWQQFRHRIVGFEERTYDTLPDGTFFYGTKKGLQSEKYGYSAMISATFIMSKTYLEMYHQPHFLPSAIYDYINKNMNCEDIAMCLMVTDFLRRTSFPQTCCVSVNAKRFPINLEATNRGGYRGLSMRRGHYNGRSDCLNYFAKSYNNTIPLIYTHAKVAYNDHNYYKS